MKLMLPDETLIVIHEGNELKLVLHTTLLEETLLMHSSGNQSGSKLFNVPYSANKCFK